MSLKSHFQYIQIIQANHYPKIGDCRLFTKFILLPRGGLKFVLAPDFSLPIYHLARPLKRKVYWQMDTLVLQSLFMNFFFDGEETCV